MKYDFPKVDLHCHLDGSFRIESMYEMAQERNIELPGKTLEGYRAWMNEHADAKDVNDYLKMFDWPTAILQDKDSLIRTTRELVEDRAKEGLRYVEIRFAPQLHTQKDLSQRDAIEAVLEGKRQGEEANPSIKVGIILCMMSFGPEKLSHEANKETASIIHEYLDKGVVCLDLAGAEGFDPLIAYKPLFDIAKNNNVPCICHAGDSPEWPTVKDAIDMGAVRIGHGHHIYENPELCRYAAKHGIALEICPTSNVQCKTRQSYQFHPAYNLYKLGIPVTINTDNMVMARVNLDDEYDHCLNEMGFEYNDLIQMNINSFNVSFAPKEYKEEMIEILKSKLK